MTIPGRSPALSALPPEPPTGVVDDDHRTPPTSDSLPDTPTPGGASSPGAATRDPGIDWGRVGGAVLLIAVLGGLAWLVSDRSATSLAAGDGGEVTAPQALDTTTTTVQADSAAPERIRPDDRTPGQRDPFGELPEDLALPPFIFEFFGDEVPPEFLDSLEEMQRLFRDGAIDPEQLEDFFGNGGFFEFDGDIPEGRIPQDVEDFLDTLRDRLEQRFNDSQSN